MSAIEVDATRLPLLLHELRLPAIARLWPEFAERAGKEGWPAARFLAALAELEIAERGRRRIVRHLVEARLPPGKTLDNFDFSVVPMLSKARVMALAATDAWLDKAIASNNVQTDRLTLARGDTVLPAVNTPRS